MSKLTNLLVVLVVLALFAVGCQNSQNELIPVGSQSQIAERGIRPSAAAIGTEELTPIDIALAPGTGMVASGVGLRGDPVVAQPGTFTITVPGGAVVNQVILYWEGQNATDGGDTDVEVNGNPVTGALIGGTTLFFGGAWSSSYRADITGLGLVSAGVNTLSVGAMDFTRGASGDSRNNGAGVLVIYDEGTDPVHMDVRDGNDLAYHAYAPTLNTTVAQDYVFAAEGSARTGELIIFAGSVYAGRPNAISAAIDDGVPVMHYDLLGNTMGSDWDVIMIPVNVPAGATKVTVQALSEAAPGDTGDPASLAWVVSAFSIAAVPPEPGCRVTGGGVDKNGNWDGAFAKGRDDHRDRYQFGGQAGANTALQPQPKGEWTHHQQRGPSGSFVFHAGTASAPPGTEIDLIQCSDPGWCSPARQAPAKQIDFWGVGTFKNMKGVPPIIADNVVVGETLHRFEVNIDDAGEPGKSGKMDVSSCPDQGFGLHGDAEYVDCECFDFYRITIYADETEGSVIYQVYGYIKGGNLQIHPLTGYDL